MCYGTFMHPYVRSMAFMQKLIKFKNAYHLSEAALTETVLQRQ